jgi:hypothetical protein
MKVGVVLHIWEGHKEIMVSIKLYKNVGVFYFGDKRSHNRDMIGYSLGHLYYLELF